MEERALLWRFRYSLISEARALTKFLKCVDWGDAQEARQAADLMQAWAPIAIADALELLSPDFPNEQVSCLSTACLLCPSACCSWPLSIVFVFCRDALPFPTPFSSSALGSPWASQLPFDCLPSTPFVVQLLAPVCIS